MKKFHVFVTGLFLSVTLASAQQVITAEYFIDTDPGFGAGNPVSFVADSLVSIDSIPVNVTGLSIGYHWLYLRVKDSNNVWSVYRKQRFYVYDNSPIIQQIDTTKLVEAEYWIDTLAIAGTGTLIPLTPSDTIFYNDSIQNLQLDTGGHVVSVRVKDSKGNWSFIKTDSVRIEVYDVDIDVTTAPFYRTGFWGKMEVRIKNRGNKDIYDAFIMIKTTNVDSIMLTSETDSLYGFPYKSTSPIIPFNGIDFAPIWLYKLPKQAITKFDLYVKFKSTSLLAGKMPLEFDVLYDEIPSHQELFQEAGDTSFFKQSKLFYTFYGLIYRIQDTVPQLIIADSTINFKIDSTIKSIPGLFNNPISLVKIIKPVFAQSFGLTLSDSVANIYKEKALGALRLSYFEQSYSFDSTISFNRIFSQSANPCLPCNFNCPPINPPLSPKIDYWISRASCVRGCFCKCIGNIQTNVDDASQNHKGIDITYKDPSNKDWMNGKMEVKTIFDGTVIKNSYYSGQSKTYGHRVIVKTTTCNTTFYTTYAHLNPDYPLLIPEQQSIGQNITVGRASKTGRTDGHVHLHITISSDEFGANPLCDPLSLLDSEYDNKPGSEKDVLCSIHDTNECKHETPIPCDPVTFEEYKGECPPPKITDICKDPKVLNNWDPNDKVGNEGYATPRYIKPTDELQYGVLFQNVDTAQVPTHVVNIKDTLDLTKVNASTFYFESITAGEMLIVLPDTVHLQHIDTLYKEVPINNCYVHAVADFNSLTGAVEFTLTSVETSDTIPPYTPVTGVFEGFLPPDTTNFHGNGLVSFKVMPVSTIPDDTVIYNTAHIIFDSNPAIVTGTWFNTIDRIAPTSFVNALPSITNDTSFTVHWTGTDDGAGIIAYDIYSKLISDTAFTKWLSYTSLDSATYTGNWNDTLQFYSIAYDSVGNVENKLALIEASTILQDPVGINYVYNSSALKIYPNPTTGKLIIEAELEKNGKLNFEIYNLLNQKLLSFEEDDISQKFIRKEIDISHHTDGVYFIRLNIDGQNITKKFILKKN